MRNILRYEWKLFLRNRVMRALWLVVLLTGCYALYCGHSFQQTQIATVTTLDTAYQNRVAKQVKNFSGDTSTKEGKAAYADAHDPFMNEYNLHAAIWKQPAPLQALSIGQSDTQPFYNNVWLYWDNIYTSKQLEIRNPYKLMAGNFDLAFVLIYLLPIFIIACSYAVVSGDKEAGIYSLLSAQGISLKQLIVYRLLFRFLSIAALTMLLNFIGFALSGHVPFLQVLWWSGISLLYVFFWFTIIYAVVSLKKSTTISALLLVSLWVIFLLLVPSAINNTATVKDAERVELSDAQREYSSHIWELWQAKTMQLPDTLFSVKPEWKNYPVKDTEDVRSVAYSYLTLLYMNGKGRRIDSLALAEQQRLSRYNYINPAYAAQQAFNQLAGSEASSFIGYRNAASAYQQTRNEAVNEYRLSGRPFTVESIKSHPKFKQADNHITGEQWLLLMLPLIVLSIVCIGFAEVLLKMIRL